MSKQKKYKVICVAVSGKRNGIHKYGSVVTADQVNDIDYLLKDKAVELAEEDSEKDEAIARLKEIDFDGETDYKELKSLAKILDIKVDGRKESDYVEALKKYVSELK